VTPEGIVEKVRDRYGKIAEGTLAGACCGVANNSCGDTETAVALGIGYDRQDLALIPDEANLGLGCGAPIGSLSLQPGETVLDLGSGPGLDALLAARKVGPTGRVIGVDMTPEMLEKARRNAQRAGLTQVEFREGRLESLPVADASVDAVTSNCVINLVPDKAAVFREVARVLRPGGRLVISDIILDGRLPQALEQDLLAWVGCIAGAMPREQYFGLVTAAGLGNPEILHDVDYLAGLAKAAPEEAQTILTRTGTKIEDVLGKVRSVTFRAFRASE